MRSIRRRYNCIRIFRYFTLSKIYFSFNNKDATIRIWDAHTGIQLKVIESHTDLVRTLQFNSRVIVSGSYDSHIKVFDFQSGKLIVELNGGHTSKVFKIQFDNTQIVSCSQDQKVIIWNFAHDVDESYFV